VFDLNADGATLHEFLSADARLGPWAEKVPGLRVPGAWNGFETAIRAVLGQQVSVARGTDLANKMIVSYGEGLFPTAQQLLGREVAELGMPGRRGRAVVRLAEMAVAGDLVIDECQDFDDLQQQLQAVDGIGPWTANYVRMRALKDPNAFPDNDWVVLKELQCTAAKARQHAQAWQPWRAYALMYLWYAAGVKRAAGKN
jgi:3-methyladenine DNA glycosylase/8-oxoguanine DNA glycosylase